MVSTVGNTGIRYRTRARMGSIVAYSAVLAGRLTRKDALESNPSTRRQEQQLNALLGGYPRNHTYRIRDKNLIPCFRLYERLSLIAPAYPERMDSFLDIGCCRGFFVLSAAGYPGCRLAVGIDVHQPFVTTAQKVKAYINAENAAFYVASLDDMANNPARYGGPFSTVLLIGTYHYLFWGSGLCPFGYRNHKEILSRLAQVCTQRCIISARLEINRLPGDLRREARKMPEAAQYSIGGFLHSAGEFFETRKIGALGRDPLFVLLTHSSKERFE